MKSNNKILSFDNIKEVTPTIINKIDTIIKEEFKDNKTDARENTSTENKIKNSFVNYNVKWTFDNISNKINENTIKISIDLNTKETKVSFTDLKSIREFADKITSEKISNKIISSGNDKSGILELTIFTTK